MTPFTYNETVSRFGSMCLHILASGEYPRPRQAVLPPPPPPPRAAAATGCRRRAAACFVAVEATEGRRVISLNACVPQKMRLPSHRDSRTKCDSAGLNLEFLEKSPMSLYLLRLIVQILIWDLQNPANPNVYTPGQVLQSARVPAPLSLKST